jgi:hypothetical protein
MQYTVAGLAEATNIFRLSTAANHYSSIRQADSIQMGRAFDVLSVSGTRW